MAASTACRSSPDLAALEKQFGDKLLIVGVHSAKFQGEKGSDRILAAAQRFGLKHPVINDSDFRIWNNFNVEAWPTLILINDKGDVLRSWAGEGHRAEIAKAVSDAIGNPTIAPYKAAAFVRPDDNNGILSFPSRLAYDPASRQFFAADTGHNRIVGFLADGTVNFVIGTGAAGTNDGAYAVAQFDHPRGVAFMNGNLYVADTGNNEIRRVDFGLRSVATVAGTGALGSEPVRGTVAAKSASLASPWDIESAPDGKSVYIAMAGRHQIVAYDPAKQTLAPAAGSGAEGIRDGDAQSAALAQPSALSAQGDTLFFADAESSSLRAFRGGKVTTLIGTGLFDFGLVDGTYPKAMLQHAQGLFAAAGKIYLADTYNNAIRVYDRRTKTLSTLKLPAGALKEPGDVLPVGDLLYIADADDHAVKVVNLANGALSALALKLPAPK